MTKIITIILLLALCCTALFACVQSPATPPADGGTGDSTGGAPSDGIGGAGDTGTPDVPSGGTPDEIPGGTPDGGADDGITYVSALRQTPSGKTYLTVDGKPYTLIGAQIRVDGLYNRDPALTDAPAPVTDEELEAYFALAAANGINTVELPLDWARLEPVQDTYDFSSADKLLVLANKYGLRCEFLWFSTNMCGDGHGFSIPKYIMDDAATYPRYEANSLYFDSMYGQLCYLVLNDPDLMARETKMLVELMAHIDRWNRENGGKNPLIGMQIHNESDGLLRWRLGQKDLRYNGVSVSPEALWQSTLDALDNAGRAVKAASYRIYTRCNMTVTLGTGEFPQWAGKGFSPLDVLALEGIDIVGDDAYTTNPSAVNAAMRDYAVNGNLPHIAENMGGYASSPSLFLTTYQAGGAYMFYDLATPQYFVYLNNRLSSDYHMDQGLFNPDLTEKAHTAETVRIIRGIAAMGDVLPLVDPDDFAAFNVKGETPATRLTQTICTSGLSLTYTTEAGGIAFAIEHEGYVYLYATADCRFSINNASYILRGEIGAFRDGAYEVTDRVYLSPSGISLEAGQLMRVRIRSVTAPVTSTTAQNV